MSELISKVQLDGIKPKSNEELEMLELVKRFSSITSKREPSIEKQTIDNEQCVVVC